MWSSEAGDRLRISDVRTIETESTNAGKISGSRERFVRYGCIIQIQPMEALDTDEAFEPASVRRLWASSSRCNFGQRGQTRHAFIGKSV